MIQAKNITHYYNDDMALKDIGISIKKGELVALVGESGSGKSTLLSVLSTLLKPTSGEILFDNLNYKDIKDIDNFRASNIGFIFQFHYLINYLSVKENILLASKKATTKDIVALLKLLNIEELLNKFPNEISGGQRQRVAIARALINNPKIIFADEPTGNLDTKNSLNVFEILRKLSKKSTTIIIATHDNKLAKLCDKIIEVKDGQLQ